MTKSHIALLVGVALVTIGPVRAQQDQVKFLPEHRAIANATLILKQAAGVTTRGLYVNSPDRATLTGGGPNMVIKRSDPCIYEITPAEGGGKVRIDFSKLSQRYTTTRNGLAIYGTAGAVCFPASATMAARCFDNLQLMNGDTQDLASIAFVQESGDKCAPYQIPATQPRF